MSELIKKMPAIALRGMTVLPSMIVHFDISRDKSVLAVETAMQADQLIFLVTQQNPDVADPDFQDLYRVGTIARIKNLAKLPQNIIRVMVEGLERGEMTDLDSEEGYLKAEIVTGSLEDQPKLGEADEVAMLRALKDIFTAFCGENKRIGKELARQILEYTDLEQLVEQIAINIPMYYEDKQRILEAASLAERYDALCLIIGKELEIMRIKNEIQQKVKARIDKNQKEYILREQLKLIQEELGEDTPLNDADQYRKQLKQLVASEEVKKKISKEIDRFKNLGGNSAEASVSRGYIETLLELPWDRMSQDNEDLKFAKKVLDEDHYGLEKVKERVMEFLAVRTLTKKGDSPILCLVGPPGTGKTSIARSVARALNKKYVRICLGGVRDEAEIRGHRRTYIGAMPGRIASGMRTAGVKNPLMLLDEIDKVSSDYKGDTSSALLEVLDSEQNNKFRDHYVELPMDLSEVLFIATANDAHTIPRPLLDRMEVIEVSSYTENEKLHIAKDHLVKKQQEHHGLTEKQLSITNGALQKMISGYTKEAGVRQLERKIGEICRKAAREILEEHKESVKVKAGNLEQYLGRAKYTIQKLNDKDEVGIVRGLAWTSVGGDTLQIEVNLMPGKGEFLLTGQLGDVMKESAQAGISYIRSVSEIYEIKEEFFQKHDIHIHIPEGAVPKDGPSAGITMATAMLSAITDTPVRADVAMTGEITLRGRVLPIGGLKEKLLAAKNAGMRTVIVPEENRADVAELSQEIVGGLKMVYARTMEDVLKAAFAK